MLSKYVLLLKSHSGENSRDEYERVLSTNDFIVRCVKTLDFEFKNTDVLNSKLRNNTYYEGLILFSPRCAHAVSLAVDSHQNIIDKWRTKHNFSIGEATYKNSLKKLSLETKGKESGSVANLLKTNFKEKSLYTKPFLIPHGDVKADTNLEFEKIGVAVEGVEVYNTITNPAIEKEISDATYNYKIVPEYIIFFSPSGFHSSFMHLRKLPTDLNDIKIIAIGPVTAQAIKKANIRVWGVAEKPTAQEVLKLLLKKLIKNGRN